MSTQKKWKLAQMLCLAVMLAGVIGLEVSVFGEAGPAAPWREETAEALRCGATWRASWPSAAGRGSEPQPWGPGRPSGDCRATGSSNQKVLPWPRVLVTP